MSMIKDINLVDYHHAPLSHLVLALLEGNEYVVQDTTGSYEPFVTWEEAEESAWERAGGSQNRFEANYSILPILGEIKWHLDPNDVGEDIAEENRSWLRRQHLDVQAAVTHALAQEQAEREEWEEMKAKPTIQLRVDRYAGAGHAWHNPKTGETIYMGENAAGQPGVPYNFEQYRDAARTYLGRHGGPVVSGVMGSGQFMPNDPAAMEDYASQLQQPPGSLVPWLQMTDNRACGTIKAHYNGKNWTFSMASYSHPDEVVWRDLLRSQPYKHWAARFGVSETSVARWASGVHPVPESHKPAIAHDCGWNYAVELKRK